MQWTDQAIILSTRKYSDSSAIVTSFTLEHGLHKGLVRGVTNKNNRAIYMPGNKVDITWRGRLEEQLGNFQAQLITPISARCLESQLKLVVLCSVCSLVECTLAERDPHQRLFQIVDMFLHELKDSSHLQWLANYIRFEIILLSELGFRLSLDKCAATGGHENLIYVSPKSGAAICAQAGEPYKDRLLALPQFLIDSNATKTVSELKNGLDLSTYFLNKYVFHPDQGTRYHKLPSARIRLGQVVAQTIAAEVL